MIFNDIPPYYWTICLNPLCLKAEYQHLEDPENSKCRTCGSKIKARPPFNSKEDNEMGNQ